jgi:hypothetical protein
MFNFFKKRNEKKLKNQSEQALSSVWGTLREWELQSGMEKDNIPHQIVDGLSEPKPVLEVFEEYCDTQDITGRGYSPSITGRQDGNDYEAYFFPIFVVLSMRLASGDLGYYIFARKDRNHLTSKMDVAFLEMVSLANPKEVIFGLRKCMIHSRHGVEKNANKE